MEHWWVTRADVGEAAASTYLHKAEGQISRLQHTCCTAEERMHGGGLCTPMSLPFSPKGGDWHRRKCNAIHKTIVEQFKHAIVYGTSVKHQPQRVGLAHELADEDISSSFLAARLALYNDCDLDNANAC